MIRPDIEGGGFDATAGAPPRGWRRLAARQLLRGQVRNLRRIVNRVPVVQPEFTSQTLGRDDLAIIKRWQGKRRPAPWDDQGTIGDYQRTFAKWNGSNHAFSFLGGRVALSAILNALEVGPGDEVIVPGYTCVVVPNAVEYTGAKVVFTDIELDTYGLHLQSVRERVGPKTKAILMQHLFGLVSRDYEELVEFAAARDIALIEDCAHSTGATLRGKRVGNRGDAALYSSERSKAFTTEQGGMATTNRDDLAERMADFQARAPFPSQARTAALLDSVHWSYLRYCHRQRWLTAYTGAFRYGPNWVVSTGAGEEQGVEPSHYGQRLPAPLAAMGINQINKLDAINARRRRTALYWDDVVIEQGYKPPMVVAGSEPIYLRYPVLVEPQVKQKPYLSRQRFGVTVGYWFLSHAHPAPRVVEGCPNADEAVRRCINLPGLMK